MDFEWVDPSLIDQLTEDEQKLLGYLAIQIHPIPEGEKSLTLRQLRSRIKAAKADLEKPE